MMTMATGYTGMYQARLLQENLDYMGAIFAKHAMGKDSIAVVLDGLGMNAF